MVYFEFGWISSVVLVSFWSIARKKDFLCRVYFQSHFKRIQFQEDRSHLRGFKEAHTICMGLSRVWSRINTLGRHFEITVLIFFLYTLSSKYLDSCMAIYFMQSENRKPCMISCLASNIIENWKLRASSILLRSITNLIKPSYAGNTIKKKFFKNHSMSFWTDTNNFFSPGSIFTYIDNNFFC